METKLAPQRYQRIAQDLEKLPCELHGDILDELEYSQLIRLSSCAGPRLTWSLKNSRSLWGKYFRGEDMSKWQTLLSITDRVKFACFKKPESKEDLPDVFKEKGRLYFLTYRNSDWKHELDKNWTRFRQERGELGTRWLSELNAIILTETWTTFHEDYSRIVVPILPKLPVQASAIFSRIPELGERDYKYQHHADGAVFSADKLAAFVDMYQQVRLVRAETLAAELYRLADIYEAHPTRLKQPFDPRTQAPDEFNAEHIPTQMRREAQRMVKRAKTARWNSKDVKPFRFKYPPLVPYESQVQSFHDCLEDVARNHGVDKHQLEPMEILKKGEAVVVNAPDWAREDAEGEVDGVADLCTVLENQHISERRLTPKLCIRASRFQSAGLPVLPRGDAELDWLEDFAEATAWLEGSSRHGLENIG
ncbi:uncharacterized protein J4E92_008604 [Alternaria infectoria]|uniref:uncharacterized protein n=1 Tax=Alternaria infectoria TaxID=45303 RepID=UPI00221F52DE|nr:uncharacterized protein J4E92_008604 [Alternaria infectoria]KAI4920385.1 hypothetical protein J4E92_008604 [Alternaria infectoria]